MSPAELEAYLHAHIPLSKAMQVSVRMADDAAVVLAAPLAPNINHRETVFGGSASAVAILAAWSLLHTRIQSAAIESSLVKQRNSMDYGLPITGDFTARSFLSNEAQAWPAFLRILARKGRGRIAVEAVLEQEGREVGRLEGEFVALGALAT